MPECGLHVSSGSIPITDETLALHTMNTPDSLVNFSIAPLKPRVSQRSCSAVQIQRPLRDSIFPFEGNGAIFNGAEGFEVDVRL
jgi:hypothetical protein